MFDLILFIFLVIGFLLKERIFEFIVKIYKKEKYDTLAAFKNNN